MKQVTAAGLCLLMSLTLTACPQRTAVWVRDGSTADNLVFQFGTSRGEPGGAQIGVVRVYHCDGPATGPGAAWVVGPEGGTADVRELRYGQTPAGFTSDQGPSRLEAGCYRVDVSGTGKTEFVIDSTGRVTERPRGG